jgi:transcriptional regulator
LVLVEEFYTDEDDELNKLDGDKADKIDNLIESLNRKQEQQGIKIECETSELILLDKIQHWAKKSSLRK